MLGLTTPSSDWISLSWYGLTICLKLNKICFDLSQRLQRSQLNSYIFISTYLFQNAIYSHKEIYTDFSYIHLFIVYLLSLVSFEFTWWLTWIVIFKLITGFLNMLIRCLFIKILFMNNNKVELVNISYRKQNYI